jgi:exodeoxyribonuclease V alpha subunit
VSKRVSSLASLESGPETLRGTITRLFTANPSFSAGKLDSQDRATPVSFTAPVMLVEGARINITGTWHQDPKYGMQFKGKSVEYDMNMDVHGLARWLEKSTVLKGIGNARAQRIAKTYGEKFDEVITSEGGPERVAEETKINLETILTLRNFWIDHQEDYKLNTWLASLGLSMNEIEKIREKYGHNAFGVLQANPYLLMDEIEGFGFKKTDAIARKTGIPKNSDSRIRHGILAAIKESLDTVGSTYLEFSELIITAHRLLELDSLDAKDIIEQAVRQLIDNRDLSVQSLGDGELAVMLPWVRAAEEYIAERLMNPPELTNITPPARHFLDHNALGLNADQQTAFRSVVENSISLVSGGAGVGKTYWARAIVVFFVEILHKKVVLCAPTGKAARRLSESTGHSASTIHIALGYNPFEGFRYNEDNPVDADIIIVDEVSMLDSLLAHSLLKAIDPIRTRIVFIGDHHQLPPVGAGNLLRDLIQTKAIPTTILTECLRQKGTLEGNCSAILEGRLEKTPKAGEGDAGSWQLVSSPQEQLDCFLLVSHMAEQIIRNHPNFNIIDDFQILTPQNKGVTGVNSLNAEIQRKVQRIKYGVEVEPTGERKRPKFYKHDKVLQVKNDYKLDIRNGDIGQIKEILDDGSVVVDFVGYGELITIPPEKLKNLTLAYAMTIHKSQGSEFKFVVAIIHKASSYMNHRGLVYTACTRASKKLILCGDSWGLHAAVKKVMVDSRKTWLSVALKRKAA